MIVAQITHRSGTRSPHDTHDVRVKLTHGARIVVRTEVDDYREREGATSLECLDRRDALIGMPADVHGRADLPAAQVRREEEIGAVRDRVAVDVEMLAPFRPRRCGYRRRDCGEDRAKRQTAENSTGHRPRLVPAAARSRLSLHNVSMGTGYVGIYSVRALPSRQPFAEGEAHGRPVGEVAAPEPGRVLDRRGRSSRRLAAGTAHVFLHRREKPARQSGCSTTRSGGWPRRVSSRSAWSAVSSASTTESCRDEIVADGGRMRRVDEAVKQVLSEAIPELKDPGLGFVTVTGVRTDSRLAHATVWVSVIGQRNGSSREHWRRSTALGGVLQSRDRPGAAATPDPATHLRVRSRGRARRAPDPSDRRARSRPRGRPEDAGSE